MLEFLLNNNFILSILAFALILIPAVIIHELGHFFAAKMVGINVLEFGIGFPPRAMRLFTWGETEFTLNWLPIGGFVRPLGEDMIGPVIEEDEDEDDAAYPKSDYEEEKPKKTAYVSEREELMARGVPEEKLLSVNEAKPWPRIFFMAAGAIANVVSAIILFIIAALIGIPEEVGARVQITDIPSQSIFAQSPVERGDAIEKINDEFFTTPQAFFQRWQALNGEMVTLTMRSFETNANYEIRVAPNVNALRGYVFVTAIVEDAPAHKAGLRPEDLIIAINGRFMNPNDPVGDIQAATEEMAGQAITLTVLRDGEPLNLTLVPRENPPPNQGRIGIGIVAQYETSDGVRYMEANAQQELIPQPLGTAVQYGFGRTFQILKLFVTLPAQIIDGTISPEEARPVSIIGISQVGGQFLQRSIEDGTPTVILEFLALISIFLGATNLLPFPPLDGGRIVFVFIELARGKPVPARIENLVYRIGITLLLGLGLLIILYDIFNPLVLPQ